MEERIRPTKSGLFAIELLIAVGIFSLCAAICVGLFVRAEVMSQDAADLNRAVSAARSAAECYKAVGGDLDRTAELTGGRVEKGRLVLAYDQDWQPLGECATGELRLFLLELTPREAEGYAAAELRVTGPLTEESFLIEDVLEKEGEALLSWDVASREGETILSWDIGALEVRP